MNFMQMADTRLCTFISVHPLNLKLQSGLAGRTEGLQQFRSISGGSHQIFAVISFLITFLSYLLAEIGLQEAIDSDKVKS